MPPDLDLIPQNAQEAETLINQLGEAGGEEGLGAAAATPPAPQEYAINYKGKEEKYPLEKILAFANQGRDYNEKMQAFNQQKTRWTQLEQEYNGAKTQWAQVEQRLKNYSDIEAYQKQDPAWWQHVNESYEQRMQERGGGQHGAPAAALPPEVAKQISDFNEFMTSQKQREQVEVAAREDQALDLQVSSYREKYPQFEWDKVDENGLNLEKRVLQYMSDNGLTKPEQFPLAANNFLLDEHLKRAGHAAKDGVGRHLEKVTKLGLGPITTQPSLKIQQVRNVANKDWNEIAEEAKAALGV